MSAFSFVDEAPAESSEEVSAFAFASSDEPIETRHSPAHTPKPLSTIKKSGPRVIATAKKGKKENKKDTKKGGMKFAKAPSSEKLDIKPKSKSPGFQFTSSEQEAESHEDPVASNEGSAFDFGSMGSQEEPRSAFDFGSAVESTEQSSSAFDFGSSVASTEQSTSGFDFGSSQPVEEEASSFNFGSQEPIQSEESPLDAFYESLTNIRQGAFVTLDAISQTREKIKETEEELEKMLKTESFGEAEKLNSEIKGLKDSLREKKSDFYDYLMQAMDLTNSVPQFLHDQKSENEVKVPTLKSELEAYEARLINLTTLQNEDKQKIEMERKSIASKVEELRKELQEDEESFVNKRESLLDEIADARKPVEMEVLGFQLDRKHHEDAIEELLRQIEEHKSEMAKIDKEIAGKYKILEGIEYSYKEKKDELADQEAHLEKAKEEVNQAIADLESPFKTLIDDVREREQQISSTANLIEETKVQLETTVKEISLTEDAEATLNSLCESFMTFYEKRSALNEKLELVTAQINAEVSHNYIVDIIEVTGKKERAEEAVKEAKIKLPALEAAKKAAVMSKNFRGAQKASDQIKETSEALTQNEEIISQCTEQLEKLEILADQSRKSILSHTAESDSIMNEILNADYEIYTLTFKKLKELFEISSFCSEILTPFYELIENAVNNCEKPVVESVEELTSKLHELEQQLEKAAEIEDFALAGQLQDQIDVLQERISNQ